MDRFLQIKIKDNCIKCPYCNYEDSDYICTLAERRFILYLGEHTWEYEKRIPEWCPLPIFQGENE